MYHTACIDRCRYLLYSTNHLNTRTENINKSMQAKMPLLMKVFWHVTSLISIFHFKASSFRSGPVFTSFPSQDKTGKLGHDHFLISGLICAVAAASIKFQDFFFFFVIRMKSSPFAWLPVSTSCPGGWWNWFVVCYQWQLGFLWSWRENCYVG